MQNGYQTNVSHQHIIQKPNEQVNAESLKETVRASRNLIGRVGTGGLNVESLSGNLTLSWEKDVAWQRLDVNGAPRTITFGTAKQTPPGAAFHVLVTGLTLANTVTINGTTYGDATHGSVLLDVVFDGNNWVNFLP